MTLLDLDIRPAVPADADAMAAYAARNAAHLRPFEPQRPAGFATAAAIHARLTAQQSAAAPTGVQYVAFLDGELVAKVAISNIVRAAFQSAHLGYSVDEAHCGRGVATRAVAVVVEEAFTAHGLHRVEAGTLVDNLASQAVLQRNGFERIGLSPRHLQIAGSWRDHVLFARTHGEPTARD